MSDQQSQTYRLLTLNRRIYQTYYIASKRTRSVRLRTKILNFLGIAIPLVGGGIVTTFYANNKVPDVVLVITGAFALAQVVMSLWALSDEWDRQGKLNEMTLAQFSELRGQLERLRPDSTGSYDETSLRDIERRSTVGLSYDDELGVSDSEREEAWDVAVSRFPDPPATSIPAPSVKVQKTPVIRPEDARFGIALGFAIGRLEVIDKSPFPEAKAAEQGLRREIKQMLSREKDDALAAASDGDGRELMHIVLNYFAIRDIKIHAAILIGIGALRLSLSDGSSSPAKTEELRKLALSAFMEIDAHVVADRQSLFDSIGALDEFNVPEICRVVATLPA
jgi:mobilome CxxCx(11)CxxC protein